MWLEGGAELENKMPNKMVNTIDCAVLTNTSALTGGGCLLSLVTHILSPNDFLKVAVQRNILSLKQLT